MRGQRELSGDVLRMPRLKNIRVVLNTRRACREELATEFAGDKK